MDLSWKRVIHFEVLVLKAFKTSPKPHAPCCAIASLSVSFAESQDHTFVKCSQLPGILEMEKHSIKEEECLLKKDRAIREKYYQVLLSGILFWVYYSLLGDLSQLVGCLVDSAVLVC